MLSRGRRATATERAASHVDASPAIPVPPLALAAAAACAQHLLATRGRGGASPAGGVSRADRCAPGKTSDATRAVSAVLAVGLGGVSAWLVGGSVTQFARRRTTVDPRAGAQPAALVVDGPNARTRNPMYLGMACALFAHAALRRSWAAALPAAAFVAVMDRSQIPAEERALAAGFGKEYERYRAAVPRWVGLPGAPRRIETAAP